MSLKEVISQDFWIHVGALIAIAIGLADYWHTPVAGGFGQTADLMFIIAGLAGLGLKLVNGSAAAIRAAAAATAAQTVTTAAATAAETVKTAAATAAADVKAP